MKHLQIKLGNRTECFERKKHVLKIRGQFPYSKAKTEGVCPDKFL